MSLSTSERKTETDDGAVHVERHGAVEGGVHAGAAGVEDREPELCRQRLVHVIV